MPSQGIVKNTSGIGICTGKFKMLTGRFLECDKKIQGGKSSGYIQEDRKIQGFTGKGGFFGPES